MSMPYLSTIQELIDFIKDEEISYRNLHLPIYIHNTKTDDIIRVPYQSIFAKYIDYFRSIRIKSSFSEREIMKYRYKPKMLSNDLYDTTELWSVLLEINGFSSIIDFNLEKPIYVLHPGRMLDILNEILILEEILT